MRKQLIALLMVVILIPFASLADGPPLERYLELPAEMQSLQPAGFTFVDGILVPDGVAYLLFRNGIDFNLTIAQLDSKGAWKSVVSSKTALPGGDIDYSLTSDVPDRVYVRKSENEYYTFKKENNSWYLVCYVFITSDEEIVINFEEGKIVYENRFTGDKNTARGEYQRNLRYLNINTIPFSYKEARNKLSNPPEIPAGGLQAQRVHFTSGQKFPVYTGPGPGFLRAAGGRAAVSTNDWIQVFGVENGWAMIQYDLSSTQMRIGYIEASSLPKNTQVSDLNLVYHPRVIGVAVSLTDDPLFSRHSLLSLPTGSEVTHLHNLGSEWAYIEHMNSQTRVRGFVPQSTLSDQPSLSLAPDGALHIAKAFSAYQAKAVVEFEQNENLTLWVYAILPAAWTSSPSQGDALIDYRFYDGNRPGDWLQKEPDHKGLTVFSLQNLPRPESGLIGLIPVYSRSGEVAAESLIIPIDK